MPKGDKLTERQKLFCKLYATDREFFCNGVRSYMEAFKEDDNNYNNAKTKAYQLLQNSTILKEIDRLTELESLNDSFVDKQLGKLVQQDADLKVKVQAIKEYNVLKSRITKQVDVKSGGQPITEIKYVTPEPEDEE